MAIDLQELVARLDSIGSRLLERPRAPRLHSALLDDTQLMAELTKSPDLPIYIRSIAREIEAKANAVSRAVEAFNDSPLGGRARLAELVGELRVALAELRAALQRGQG